MSVVVLLIIAGVFDASRSRAQSQGTALAFEVTTIRPGDPNVNFFGGSCHGTDSKYSGFLPISPPALGRCHFMQVTLKMLIQEAYDFRGPNSNDMVVGGPKWITSQRFTIEGKAEEPTTVTNMRLMLRSLLQSRFKLKAHTETRDLPGYALVIGRSGSKLKP